MRPRNAGVCRTLPTDAADSRYSLRGPDPRRRKSRGNHLLGDVASTNGRCCRFARATARRPYDPGETRDRAGPHVGSSGGGSARREDGLNGSHRLKLDRAVEHLYALEAASERWSQTDPCALWSDCELGTRKHRTYIESVRQPIDPLIPLRLGDCVHNMRHALEHIAYEIAACITESTPPLNEGTAGFPIVAPRKGETPARTASRFDDGLASKLGLPKKKMPAALYTVIEGLQPYNGGNRMLLHILSELDNLDKHRLPPVVAGVAKVYGLESSNAVFTYVRQLLSGVAEPHAPVVEYILAESHGGVQVDIHVAGAIAFDKISSVAPGEFVLPLLSAIRLFILREVFPPLERFL